MLSGMPKSNALVGSAETCQILSVHPATLLRWIKAGRLTPAHKLPGDNGAYLFSRADVEKVAAERAEQASA